MADDAPVPQDAARESITSKQTWRHPSSTDEAYFTQLAGWGYSLSEVEQIVTNAPGGSSAEATDYEPDENLGTDEDQPS